MEERSIRVEIAGRAYPLTIHAREEENVRLAVGQMNESIERLRGHYPLTDKQDLLAMAALEVTTRALNGAGVDPQEEVAAEVARLEAMLRDALA
jgi:cell division protein ZapA